MTKFPKISATSSSTPDSGPKLIAEEHGIAASQAYLEKGIRLWSLIERCPKADGVISILRAAEDMPFGVHAWHGVRETGFDIITSDWPRILSPMQRHKDEKMFIVLPPLWRGRVDESSYRDFCQLRGKDFVRRLALELNDPYLEMTFSHEDDVFMALGSRWIGMLPPLLFSYCNFRFDAGAPRSIDLESSIIPRYSRASRKQPIMDQVEMALATVLKKIRSADRRGRIGRPALVKMLDRIEHEFSFECDDARWRVLRLLLLRGDLPRVKAKFPERLPEPRKRQSTSIARMIGQIGNVGDLIEAIKSGDEQGRIPINNPQRAVLAYFIEALGEEEFSDEEILRFKVAQFAPRRKFDLRHPIVYRDYLGLGEPVFEPHGRLDAAARRILACFLHYDGRRAACVALMTIGDLAMGCSPNSDEFTAFCRYTKNRSQRGGWHPISYLWPDSELAFARSFLAACRAAGLPDTLQLMQVAGLGLRIKGAENAAYTKHTVDFAQLRLRDGLVPGRRLSTHLKRFAFASYWHLRVLAATFPFLRSTPLFQQLQSHFWFQDEGIGKIGRLLQYVPNDHVVAAASIMGLSSPEQFVSTYNRGQALEMIAWRDVLRRGSSPIPA